MSLCNKVILSVGYQLLSNPNYVVRFVGHSLGGAMARLTFYFVKSCNQFPNTVLELYTYGEPRVGNKAFADYFNALSYTTARIVNKYDIVPHFPPTSILSTTLFYDYYIHPQLEVWILDSGIHVCNPNYYEDPSCSNSVDPSYISGDHVTYFNVTIDCSENVIPAPPPGNPPSLPTKIFNFDGGAINFFSGLLLG